MRLHIKKTQELNGQAKIAGSKSHAIRALFFDLLAGGGSEIKNLPKNEDVKTAVRVTKEFAAGLPLKLKRNKIFTGDSGLTTRFLLPILGLREDYEKPVQFEMGQQMRTRPVQPLINALNQLGMEIELPVVKGQLKGGKAKIFGETSQYLSALLMALPCAENDSEITVENLQETPYVEMTLNWLTELGIEWKREGDTFYIKGGQTYKLFKKTIPGDYSSAAFLIAAGALVPGEIEIEGLDAEDPQSDRAIVDLLENAWSGENTEIDCNAFPDLLPVLAVIGTQMPGSTKLFNVANARLKETDRIHSMAVELAKMGVKIEEVEDGLIVQRSDLKGAELLSHGDHRTAMALAIAGMLADGETIVHGAEYIRKTFPEFVDVMQKLGANMQIRSHVALMGFKNVGKTRVGRRLAYDLDMPFVDLDEFVEQKYGKSGKKIVEENGEKFFRELEHEALKKVLSETDSCVLALGGGTPIYKKNRRLLKNVYLIHVTDTKERVLARIKDEGRPAFFGPGSLEQNFEKFWAERIPVYEELADKTLKNV